MTTVDLTATKGREFPVNLGERNIGRWVMRLVKHSDFAAADDIVQLITIPENSLIGRVIIVTKEAWDGTAPQVNVGDGNDPNGYIADADYTPSDLNLCADTDTGNTAAAFMVAAARYFYTAADTLDVEAGFSGSQTTGESIVCAEIITVPGV